MQTNSTVVHYSLSTRLCCTCNLPVATSGLTVFKQLIYYYKTSGPQAFT